MHSWDPGGSRLQGSETRCGQRELRSGEDRRKSAPQKMNHACGGQTVCGFSFYSLQSI